jgi:hypothetical protein
MGFASNRQGDSANQGQTTIRAAQIVVSPRFHLLFHLTPTPAAREVGSPIPKRGLSPSCPDGLGFLERP